MALKKTPEENEVNPDEVQAAADAPAADAPAADAPAADAPATPKHKINAAPYGATAWMYKGRVLTPGEEVELSDEDFEALTERGTIGKKNKVKDVKPYPNEVSED